jgi:hypothetical protein
MEFMLGIPSFVHFGAGISTKLGDIAAGASTSRA